MFCTIKPLPTGITDTYFGRMEHHANLLWIPADSPYNVNEVGWIKYRWSTFCILIVQDWLESFFKKNERDQIVLFKSENVLTPKALNEVNLIK